VNEHVILSDTLPSCQLRDVTKVINHFILVLAHGYSHHFCSVARFRNGQFNLPEWPHCLFIFVSGSIVLDY
jgi:hypothetical protein